MCFAFVFRIVCLSACISSVGCFELNSIDQCSKATEDEVIRASQGGLYPPWSLMLSHIYVNGGGGRVCFPQEITLGEEMYERGCLHDPLYLFILSFWLGCIVLRGMKISTAKIYVLRSMVLIAYWTPPPPPTFCL
jgi:hypothetical protein